MPVDDEQKLYVRLFLRKHRWILKSKIIYNDIACDLSSILDCITNSGLIINGILYCCQVFITVLPRNAVCMHMFFKLLSGNEFASLW